MNRIRGRNAGPSFSTPFDVIPGGFTFNQFLLVDEEPLLFHTDPRRLFPPTQEAVRHVLPPEKLALDRVLPRGGGRMRGVERMARSRAGREAALEPDSRYGLDHPRRYWPTRAG